MALIGIVASTFIFILWLEKWLTKISPYINPPIPLSNYSFMNENKGNDHQLQKLLIVNILFVLSTSYEIYSEDYVEYAYWC